MSVDPIAVAGLVRSIMDLLANVKVYKRRCRNLSTRCEVLINGLREGDGAVPAGHQAALNEAEGILESIRGRVLQWTHLNTARSLLKQDDIRDGLDEYDRRIDTCIATYNIKISQQLAQAREQHDIAAQHDIREIRRMMQDLLVEFTRYQKNPTLNVSGTNPAFRTVVHDIIEEETREIQSPLHDVVSEENDNRMQPSILSIDTFHRQMTAFSRSLVKLELVTPYVDRNASGQSPQRARFPNQRYHTDSPSELTQSSQVGHQRLSTVSPDPPQLPLLILGGNITDLAFEETNHTEHSPSASDYPSSSRSTSAVSRSAFRVSTQNSWSSPRSSVIAPPSGTACLEIESQQPKRPPIIVDNDVASGSQSLRRFSLRVPETVWDPGRSLKAIKAETLESVIQYLLDSAENDNEQRSAFFIAHPAFVSPLHVLRILTHRYDEAFLIRHVERRVYSQARVLHLLNDWLNNEHVIFDDDILCNMREFLAFVNGAESEELDELVLDILHGICEKNYRRPPAPLIVSPSQQTHPQPLPRDLAIALTVLECERYKRIVASEYMACVSGLQPYFPNLSAAIGLNQLISKWVRSCILDESLGNGRNGIKARSKVKKYFVKTAEECRKIRNFSSSGAIISALESEVIARLTATQGGMSIRTTRTHGNLLQFFGKKCNYKDYRKALKNQQMCSIPWHVVDLEDIQAMIEGDADTAQEDNSPRIHLERWARLKRRAMYALHYQIPFTEADACQMAKDYFMAGLQREHFDQLEEERSLLLKAEEERSLLLKAEEDKIVSERAGF